MKWYTAPRKVTVIAAICVMILTLVNPFPAIITAASSIDLTVTSVNAPTIGQAGGYIAVSWTVKNQGTVASGTFYNRISLATTPYGVDISLGNFAMASISAGSSLSDAEVPQIPSSVSPGYYYVTVYADSFVQITEYNEINNIQKATYQIYVSPAVAVPTPPTLNDAFGTSNNVILAWTDSNNEDGYKIERKEGTSGTYAQVATTGTNVYAYADTGLQFGKVYCYRVRAYNSAGNSGYSNEKCATTLSTPALSYPLNGATLTTNTVTLTWSCVAGANAYAIKVSRVSCGGGDVLDGASYSCQQQLSNLANGVYYWQVQAGAFTYPGLSEYSACRYFTVAYTPLSTIAYGPSSFSFTATQGGSNPSSQPLSIWNSGGGTLSWSVSDNANWLTLTPTSGSSTGETDSVTVSASISGMSAGSYSGTITISASGATNTPQTVPVSLTISPPSPSPAIACGPSSFSFTATQGGSNPSSQPLSIWNSGGGALSWSVSDNANWLTLTPTSGSSTGETDSVTVSVSISGMSYGSYSATITISASGATNTPQTVPVALTINQPSDTNLPTVSSVSPQNNQPDVAIGTVVTATFSEAMDASAINAGSFTLAGSVVSGTVTYDPATYTATFTPNANLDYNHTYTATLSTGITDLAGNPLTAPYTWSFTTETALGGPDLAVDIISTDSLTIGERSSVTIKLENVGSASIPAKLHTINVYLKDYEFKQPSSLRWGDSFHAMKWGETSWHIYSFTIDLPELLPGDSRTERIEFLIPEPIFENGEAGIWSDTLEVYVSQYAPELYDDANKSNNGDEQDIAVSPSVDMGISCVIYWLIPFMIEYFGVEKGIALNGDLSLANNFFSLVKNVRQEDWKATVNNIVNIVLKAASMVLEDPITIATSLAKGLWEGSRNCGALALIYCQYFWGCAKALGDRFWSWVDCPVDILIMDAQGNRAGYVDGIIYEEIEGSEVIVVDDQKLVLLPWQTGYSVVLIGTGAGTMDFYMLLPAGDNIAKIVEYQDVSISQATGATVDVSPENPEYLMMLDNNGDGQVDEERYPNLTNTWPNTPTNYSPADDITDVPINPDLSWTGGDPDAGDIVTYNVYLGITEAPPLVSNNQSGITYDPGTLAYNTTYYWQIIATDDHGASTTGPLWAFTTAEAAPSDSWCFIATAAYGTPLADEIDILREFRDEYLLTNPVGEAFVDFYYKLSPPIAEFITEHPSLKPMVKVGIVPVVAMSTVVVDTTPAEKMAILGLLVLVSVAVAIWVTRRRGRGPEYM